MQLKSLENIYHINKKSNVAKWFYLLFFSICFSLCFCLGLRILKLKEMLILYFRNKDLKKLNSPIPGKNHQMVCKNGDVVKKGDTILQISEIKDDYLDPLLVERTQEQVQAKKRVREYYNAKISTTENQIAAICR